MLYRVISFSLPLFCFPAVAQLQPIARFAVPHTGRIWHVAAGESVVAFAAESPAQPGETDIVVTDFNGILLRSLHFPARVVRLAVKDGSVYVLSRNVYREQQQGFEKVAAPPSQALDLAFLGDQVAFLLANGNLLLSGKRRASLPISHSHVRIFPVADGVVAVDSILATLWHWDEPSRTLAERSLAAIPEVAEVKRRAQERPGDAGIPILLPSLAAAGDQLCAVVPLTMSGGIPVICFDKLGRVLSRHRLRVIFSEGDILFPSFLALSTTRFVLVNRRTGKVGVYPRGTP